jgi:hypothetical protein
MASSRDFPFEARAERLVETRLARSGSGTQQRLQRSVALLEAMGLRRELAWDVPPGLTACLSLLATVSLIIAVLLD